MEYTKGKWEANKDDWNQEWEIYVENYGSIACGIGDKANANLIAAAPDMYGALESVIKYKDELTYANPVALNLVLGRLDKALAKAEGKEV